MHWLSATWPRTIITILVVFLVVSTVRIGREQGWYPKDPTWSPCTTWPKDREPPCVLDDGSLLANLKGKFIVYPKEGE